MKQIEELIAKLEAALVKTDAEKALMQKSENFYLAKKLLNFHATPALLEQFRDKQAAMEALAEEMGLKNSLEHTLLFYQEARHRNDIFFKKITGDPRLGSDLAVITGGFHSEGLTEELRKAGVSFVVITPDLGGEPQNEELYLKHLQLEPPADDQALEPFLQFTRLEFRQAMVEAINIDDKTNNLTLALQGIHSRWDLSSASPTISMNQAALRGTSQEQSKSIFDIYKNAGTVTTALIMSAETFEKLSSTEVGMKVLKHTTANKKNSVIVLYSNPSQIPDKMSEVKADLRKGNFESVLGAMQRRFGTSFPNRVAVVLKKDEDIRTEALKLPEELAAVLSYNFFLAAREAYGKAFNYRSLATEILKIPELRALLQSA